MLVALEVATQVARALMAAESHQLVHRDLKPSNLMVLANDPGGADSLIVKVIDFGLAKAAVATLDKPGPAHAGFSGTPDFASPEQLSAGEMSLDIRSDIYSLGATLWYLLSGRTPVRRARAGGSARAGTTVGATGGARFHAPVIARPALDAGELIETRGRNRLGNC